MDDIKRIAESMERLELILLAMLTQETGHASSIRAGSALNEAISLRNNMKGRWQKATD